MTNLQNQLDKIKRDLIEDLQLSIRVCNHAIAFEPLSLGCQELLVSHIQYCEKVIQRMKMELSASELDNRIYNICAPLNSHNHA